MKLTFHHRTEVLGSRYVEVCPSITTKPPTYLFRYHQFQRAQRQKTLVAPMFLGAPAARLVSVFVTVECFAPPVKGYLRIDRGPRKTFFQKTFIFFRPPAPGSRFCGFAFENNKKPPCFETRLLARATTSRGRQSYPQTHPSETMESRQRIPLEAKKPIHQADFPAPTAEFSPSLRRAQGNRSRISVTASAA